MDEEKKKRKKKAADAGDSGHKKPWQETYATPEEIKAMLSERAILRYNEVRGRTEIHRLSQGFRYWFDQTEIQRLTQHNRQFETVHSELELVDLHFRKPAEGDPRELVSATMALQIIGGNLAYTLSKEKIGQAFTKLGFESKRTASQRGYIAIRRTPAEMDAYRRSLADIATSHSDRRSEYNSSSMTDDSMTAGF